MSRPVQQAPHPANAFDESFLTELDRSDEPLSAAEAEAAGPWHVEELSLRGVESWGVFHAAAGPERGGHPVARFERRELALLAAAVIPATGRDPLLRLEPDDSSAGFTLRGPSGEVEGYLRHFDQPLEEALHVAAYLTRSPASLALLLEAAGSCALRDAGRLLRRATEA
ncbi:MAG TPA: hypothetical protein VGS22_22385 [Thermoanaerobaculia bacterium]|nr:hypothetical protein [Thermoanaerobaculia bacterium]